MVDTWYHQMVDLGQIKHKHKIILLSVLNLKKEIQ